MIFGMNDDVLKKTDSTFTATEIYQQPSTWLKTYQQVLKEKDKLQDFINQVLSCDDYDVILTGAGTSEFVGNALFTCLNEQLNFKVKSYATTDITASPEHFISKTKPTLLISFGRSGNSPESIGALDAAEAVNPGIYHLFVTCNKDGFLSKRAINHPRCYALNLTDETHDRSFAMTSSFTNMFLATYLIFNLNRLEVVKKDLDVVIQNVQELIDHKYIEIKSFIETCQFDRIVYLGSNVLKGIAQESALKILELTAGRVATMHDTPLGFRHGPKSIVNPKTLTVILLSDFAYTRQYENDLLKEMSAERNGNQIIVLSNRDDKQLSDLANYVYSFHSIDLKNEFLALEYIVFGQILALFKSLSLGNTPDNPCATGVVNRVVKGVTLYPYERG